jgi:hypothetical protein
MDTSQPTGGLFPFPSGWRSQITLREVALRQLVRIGRRSLPPIRSLSVVESGPIVSVHDILHCILYPSRKTKEKCSVSQKIQKRCYDVASSPYIISLDTISITFSRGEQHNRKRKHMFSGETITVQKQGGGDHCYEKRAKLVVILFGFLCDR